MIRIYKYELNSENCTIKLPSGAEVLRVEMQSSGIFLWAAVNPDTKDFEKRRFMILATGQDIEQYENLRYINTMFVDNGTFVFHVFEVLC